MRVSIVVVTMGDRAELLDKCLRSALAQDHPDLDVLCLGNGWDPVDLPDGVRSVGLPENLGGPSGRNTAVTHTDSDVFMLLDDDAWLPETDTVRRAVARFEADERLAVLVPRLTDEHGLDQRRWVPRARVGDPMRPGPAFTCVEGISFYRRRAWDEVGGFPDNFRHGHEGIDLVWRVRNRGWTTWYDPQLLVHHPVFPANRHGYFQRLNARNRVWVARRNLPAPLIPAYVGIWTAISLTRNRTDWEGTKSWVAGWLEGWREDPGLREPMSWKTVWTLARLGQPPII